MCVKLSQQSPEHCKHESVGIAMDYLHLVLCSNGAMEANQIKCKYFINFKKPNKTPLLIKDDYKC